MKVEIDSFSSGRIYPGRGRLFIRGDSKVFRFNTSKSESLFKQRKNPRKISWTILYRRMHKKGITEEVAKKRTRRTVKHQRAIVGASLDVIKERRSMYLPGLFEWLLIVVVLKLVLLRDKKQSRRVRRSGKLRNQRRRLKRPRYRDL
jgi:ribosomal protein L24E